MKTSFGGRKITVKPPTPYRHYYLVATRHKRRRIRKKYWGYLLRNTLRKYAEGQHRALQLGVVYGQ